MRIKQKKMVGSHSEIDFLRSARVIDRIKAVSGFAVQKNVITGGLVL